VIPVVHLAIFFRNFLGCPGGLCHVGLGVNAHQTERVLRRHGVHVSVHGVPEPEDIFKALRAMPTLPSYVVIEAIWVELPQLKCLLAEFPTCRFAVRTHSQVGFLQVEPPAVKTLRQMLDLRVHNFEVASNSAHLAHFLEHTYDSPCLFLPNLYDLEHNHRRPDDYRSGPLKIASFGALRLLKNHMTSAAAALLIARQRPLEFWVSVNRVENAGSYGILQAIRNLYDGVSWARLVEHPWEDWKSFRKTIGTMHLTIQASFTETFNIVASDSVAEGVPCVVSSAIEWAPKTWRAEPDSVEDVARVGWQLLANPKAPEDGLQALRAHVRHSVQVWLHWVTRGTSTG
jgi:hypothetical protein